MDITSKGLEADLGQNAVLAQNSFEQSAVIADSTLRMRRPISIGVKPVSPSLSIS